MSALVEVRLAIPVISAELFAIILRTIIARKDEEHVVHKLVPRIAGIIVVFQVIQKLIDGDIVLGNRIESFICIALTPNNLIL